MALFNWHPDETKNEVVYNTNYFWIYWVAVTVLTLSVVTMWLLASHGTQFWTYLKNAPVRAKEKWARKAAASSRGFQRRSQGAGSFLGNKQFPSSESVMADKV
jgi:hypothetical protein